LYPAAVVDWKPESSHAVMPGTPVGKA
jgi:hypothetical protein